MNADMRCNFFVWINSYICFHIFWTEPIQMSKMIWTNWRGFCRLNGMVVVSQSYVWYKSANYRCILQLRNMHIVCCDTPGASYLSLELQLESVWTADHSLYSYHIPRNTFARLHFVVFYCGLTRPIYPALSVYSTVTWAIMISPQRRWSSGVYNGWISPHELMIHTDSRDHFSHTYKR